MTKGFEGMLVIELPQYMMNETDNNYKGIREWAVKACKDANNGDIDGLVIPSNMGIEVYIVSADGKKLLELERERQQ